MLLQGTAKIMVRLFTLVFMLAVLYLLFGGKKYIKPFIESHFKNTATASEKEALTDQPSPSISTIRNLPGVTINYDFYNDKGILHRPAVSISTRGVLHYNGKIKWVRGCSGWQQLAAFHALEEAAASFNRVPGYEWTEDINGNKFQTFGDDMMVPAGDDYMNQNGIGLAARFSVPVEEVEYMLASTVFKVTDTETNERYSIQLCDHIYEYLEVINAPHAFDTCGSSVANMFMDTMTAKAIKLFTKESLAIKSNRDEITTLTHAIVQKG